MQGALDACDAALFENAKMDRYAGSHAYLQVRRIAKLPCHGSTSILILVSDHGVFGSGLVDWRYLGSQYLLM